MDVWATDQAGRTDPGRKRHRAAPSRAAAVDASPYTPTRTTTPTTGWCAHTATHGLPSAASNARA